jgi:hypothetical protein
MVTTAEVKDELAFGSDAVGLSDAAFDSLIDSLISRETARVEDEIDVSLGTETEIEDLERPDHVNEYDLPLPSRPVQSVASVSIDTDRVGGEAVTADDYSIVDEAYLELLPAADRDGWPTERRAITVEWTHGYADGSEPDPINGAIIGLVRHALKEIESDGIESESIGGDSVTYEVSDAVIARHLGRAKRFEEPDYYGGANVV